LKVVGDCLFGLAERGRESQKNKGQREQVSLVQHLDRPLSQFWIKVQQNDTKMKTSQQYIHDFFSVRLSQY
jgi:hypothetical protein